MIPCLKTGDEKQIIHQNMLNHQKKTSRNSPLSRRHSQRGVWVSRAEWWIICVWQENEWELLYLICNEIILNHSILNKNPLWRLALTHLCTKHCRHTRRTSETVTGDSCSGLVWPRDLTWCCRQLFFKVLWPYKELAYEPLGEDWWSRTGPAHHRPTQTWVVSLISCGLSKCYPQWLLPVKGRINEWMMNAIISLAK